MQSKYLLLFVLILLVGTGCAPEKEIGRLSTVEPELNTPKLRDEEPESLARNASYFFLVENKNNNLGNDSDYGILFVRKNCENFGIIQLTKNQPLNLSVYKNQPILWKQYEFHNGEYTLKEIAEDITPQKEIENFKKTCPDPFGRYMASSVPLSGVHLYVKSLEQSSKNILNGIKAMNVVEYKPSVLTEKNQIKTFFFSVPNDKVREFEALLGKEANDGIVYGSKILYGDFSEVERAEHGTTNFEIKLISVSIL